MSEESLQQMKKELGLLNIEQVQAITGWSDAVIRREMRKKDFPLVKIGTNNQVRFEALKEYLSHRRIGVEN